MKKAEEKNQPMYECMSAEQLNPGLARPEDFEIGGEVLPGHAQRGETHREYKSLLEKSGSSTKPELKGKSGLATNPEKVR